MCLVTLHWFLKLYSKFWNQMVWISGIFQKYFGYPRSSAFFHINIKVSFSVSTKAFWVIDWNFTDSISLRRIDVLITLILLNHGYHIFFFLLLSPMFFSFNRQIFFRFFVVYSLSHVQLFCSPPGSWDFPGKNNGVGCHFLLQGIFPTQASNSHLLH